MDTKKIERLFEQRVDFQRSRDKDSQRFKVYEEVFDESTLLTLYTFMKKGVIAHFEFPISSGKEANIFRVQGGDGNPMVMKIFRVTNSSFKSIARYIEGDPRFRETKPDKRSVFSLWAKKEYVNLKKLESLGIPCPRAITQRKNCLLMEYLGSDTVSAPQLREAGPEDPRRSFEEIMRFIKTMLIDGALVHGDLSEYNILVHEGKNYVIDLAQGVSIRHPQAYEFLQRDIKNMVKYFGKYGIEEKAEEWFDAFRSERMKLDGDGPDATD